VRFAGTGLPTGITLSPTGLISGTAQANGQFRVSVTATDPDGNAATADATWLVTSPGGKDQDVSAYVTSPAAEVRPGATITLRMLVQASNPTRIGATLAIRAGEKSGTGRLTITDVRAPGWVVVSRDDAHLSLRTDPAQPPVDFPAAIEVTASAAAGRAELVWVDAQADLEPGYGRDPVPGNNRSQTWVSMQDAQPVRGFAWRDTDRDGLQGADEPPLEGFDVTLYSYKCCGPPTAVATTKTGADGRYAFPEVWGGRYQISMAPPGGVWRVTRSDVGSDDTRDSDVVFDSGYARSAVFSHADNPYATVVDGGFIEGFDAAPAAPLRTGQEAPRGAGKHAPSTAADRGPLVMPAARRAFRAAAPPAQCGQEAPRPSASPTPPGGTPAGGTPDGGASGPDAAGRLPVTGAHLAGAIGAGLALLAVGVVLMRLARRRRLTH
jgi:hypothetical protein